MGTCKFCGEKAGFLKSEHHECRIKYEREEAEKRKKRESAQEEILKICKEVAISGKDFDSLENKILSISKESFLESPDVRKFLLKGFNSVVEELLKHEDKFVTKEEEELLAKFKNHFNLSQEELGEAWIKLVKSSVLRNVINKEVLSGMKITGNLPFNFQKDEIPVWVFIPTKFYQQIHNTHYEGASTGVSVRVAKGVYFRASGFRGYPVRTAEMKYLDEGLLAVTNKHIYFSGSSEKFRIPYDKIIEFTPYEDGIGIQQSKSGAKPQIFVVGDGWFAHNLLSNLAKI